MMVSQALTIVLDDELFEASVGDNLLALLLSQGADVRYGCRAGACGACRLYDASNGESILSCQTTVSSTMSLTRQTFAESSTFSLLSRVSLDDVSIELTLLGPSDEFFGDRVFVSLPSKELPKELPKETSAEQAHFYECMALNSAGTPLKVVLLKEYLSAEDWQRALVLSSNDTLAVQLSTGIRKGRLLFEMDIVDAPVVVISSPDNAVFESYWREALLDYTSRFLGHFALSSNHELTRSLTDDALVAFLQAALAGSERVALQLIYHGQSVSAKDWAILLRALRINPTQLHFVR
ncbi:2Fe-2S iron-sulfur cluster binding domain-containing protein [Marinomonas sp. M1K-6]|uniref:2Fe-2S iron-sulfur cluster binding domain-containing protein n=1 Tax=Marinomonas profundi TaxID=2726122 RepID=A0A847R515_9GAMM|nr:2Fe-2S iron-sulfur cluster binding domain-containing protein [Marinomonas profundi]NLQ19112.1 2Fe-2S iron-sulfur cluster binding domain-containing protein [Marinomonas profundi]UDV02927.1 2Fe-2S iron-sulfur cluster binding domain-containing protein [Marinomonas profundi]